MEPLEEELTLPFSARRHHRLGKQLYSFGDRGRRTFDVALPRDVYAPAGFDEPFGVLPVTFYIPGELCLPEFGIGRRCRAVFAVGVPMPETAMYEHGQPVLGQNDVRTSGKLGYVQSKPEPHCVHS